MYLLDANILIYAHHDKPEHSRAVRHWLENTLSGPSIVGIP